MARLVPRFYFNLCDGAEFVKDDEGIELSDYAAARRKAVEGLRGVMAGDLLTGDLNTASFIEIEDESHELIELVSFADVVRMRDEPHIRLDEQPSVGRARNRHGFGLIDVRSDYHRSFRPQAVGG